MANTAHGHVGNGISVGAGGFCCSVSQLAACETHGHVQPVHMTEQDDTFYVHPKEKFRFS